MTVFAQSAQMAADDDLPALQQQLLAAAIYAAAVRTQIDQACSSHERDALIEHLERAETLRQGLEQHVARLERLRQSWWRRVRG